MAQGIGRWPTGRPAYPGKSRIEPLLRLLSRGIPSLDIDSDSWSVVTLLRLNRLGCRPGRSSQTETLIKELQMLRMNILGLGAFLILGTADLQAQVGPEPQAGAAQEVGRGTDVRARRDSDRTRPDVRPDTRPDVRPDTRPDTRPDVRPDTRPDARPDRRLHRRPDARPDHRPDVRRRTIDRRPNVAPMRGRRDVRPMRALRR